MAASDLELVQEALAGDTQSFGQIIQRYQRLVFNIVYHYLGRGGEEEDLAQEVFLKVFRSLQHYDTSRPLKHWIGRIAANQCLDEIRKRRIRKTELYSDLDEKKRARLDQLYQVSLQGGTLDSLQAQQCFDLLQEAMSVLPKKDRLAFVLRELEDQSYQDVAAMLACSEVAARIRVSRARKVLRQRLEELLDG